MKPTEEQKETIDVIISIIKTWKSTNDINSPTHVCDIEEFTYADLADIVDDSIIFEIQDQLSDLWRSIIKINK